MQKKIAVFVILLSTVVLSILTVIVFQQTAWQRSFNQETFIFVFYEEDFRKKAGNFTIEEASIVSHEERSGGETIYILKGPNGFRLRAKDVNIRFNLEDGDILVVWYTATAPDPFGRMKSPFVNGNLMSAYWDEENNLAFFIARRGGLLPKQMPIESGKELEF